MASHRTQNKNIEDAPDLHPFECCSHVPLASSHQLCLKQVLGPSLSLSTFYYFLVTVISTRNCIFVSYLLITYVIVMIYYVSKLLAGVFLYVEAWEEQKLFHGQMGPIARLMPFTQRPNGWLRDSCIDKEIIFCSQKCTGLPCGRYCDECHATDIKINMVEPTFKEICLQKSQRKKPSNNQW